MELWESIGRKSPGAERDVRLHGTVRAFSRLPNLLLFTDFVFIEPVFFKISCLLGWLLPLSSRAKILMVSPEKESPLIARLPWKADIAVLAFPIVQPQKCNFHLKRECSNAEILIAITSSKCNSFEEILKNVIC